MPYRPHFANVKVRVEVDSGRLASRERPFYGMLNVEYRDLTRTTWRRAAMIGHVERTLIAECIDQAEDDEDFRERFMEAEDSFIEEDFLDLGVAAAVRSLNAAGCPTFTSCGSHQHGCPTIVFTAKRVHLEILKDAARASAVGLVNHDGTALEVFADTSDGLVRFDEELAARKTAFGKSTRPRRKRNQPHLG